MNVFIKISFVGILFMGLSCKEKTLFEKVENSGIDFSNKVTESEKENILTYEYFYNGGGVASGDFNNDGLMDLYFTGNQVANKLYLNKSNLNDATILFEDVTQQAGVAGRQNSWKTGVSIVDINADGWLDIYVCYSGLKDSTLRKNQLFINNHNLTFTEKAAEYGLDDSGYSTQATFFDYDLDGDLDCMLINHNLGGYQRKEASIMRAERDYNAGDKLFRNNSKIDENGKFQPHFVDVSEQAGIKGNPLGFGLGVMVLDANNDNFPDIYVTNDYVEDDYLYINQKNGTFKDELRDRITHTSYSAMGIDISDINNDGFSEILTLDMLPEDNARQKLLLWPDNWNVYQAQLQNGFWHENMRNMLQLNQRNGTFAEIGQLAGISNTDWSWGVLVADFDLDGYKDVFISNGLGKDYTNADFIKYFNEEEANSTQKPLLESLKQMPTSKTKHYIFKNNQNLTFQNKQTAWGFDEPTIASGAIYADLDNDGDLEIITNNLNEPSRIYKNTLQESTLHNFIKVKLKGSKQNPFGIGATVEVSEDDKKQTQAVGITHGFESSFVGDLFFGITGKSCQITVKWQDGKKQTIRAEANKRVVIEEKENSEIGSSIISKESTIFSLEKDKISYIHQVKEINNFDRQILLPTQYSYNGPKIAIADMNNDKQDDIVIGGTNLRAGVILEKKGDKFVPKNTANMPTNNQDILIADFNGDGKKDIYWANGAYENVHFDQQNDELWLNENGNFTSHKSPLDSINNACAKIIDIDNDGDADIFLGGFIKPNLYPYCEESILLINDGKGNFKKVNLGKLGLVKDATVIDANQDGFQDIMLVGEWIPPTLLLNNKQGKLIKSQEKSLKNLAGWWNSIEKADLDGDGDEDLVLGNIGTNTQIRANENEPASLFYADFDGNGSTDFFMNYYIQGKSYPAASRDEVVEQIPFLRKKFTNYQAYSNATIDDFFEPNLLKKATKNEIYELKTIILENAGGKFIVHQLPLEAQFAPVYAILIDDFDKDGKKDILLGGNNSKFRLRIGKVSGNYGQLFKNKGGFNFNYISQSQSGLNFTGDVRAIKKVGDQLIIGINNQPINTYKLNHE